MSRVDRKPSIASIAGMTLASSWVITLTIWQWRDPNASVIGFALGVYASILTLCSTITRVIDRGEADVRKRIDEALTPETGTWRMDEHVLTVRWDQARAHYWIRGWVSDNWQIEQELAWSDLESLATLITEAERDGMRPDDDRPTRMVRARLDLPGWSMTTGLGIWPR